MSKYVVGKDSTINRRQKVVFDAQRRHKGSKFLYELVLCQRKRPTRSKKFSFREGSSIKNSYNNLLFHTSKDCWASCLNFITSDANTKSSES